MDGSVEVRIVVNVPNHKPRLDIKLEVDNQAKDHRTGLLGKEEMVRRPGRPSGIKLPPDSQMIGNLSLEFAIATYNKEENVARIAKEYLTPIVAYNKIPYDAMKLNESGVNTPLEFSFFKEMSSDVVFSTLKKAERVDGFILRLYNPLESEENFVFEFNDEIERYMQLI